MDITLVIDSLGPGGAEKVLGSLANRWADKGWNVTLISFRSTTPFYALRSSVRLTPLDLGTRGLPPLHKLGRLFSLIKRLRETIKNSHPDVVLSFMDQANILTLVSTRGLGLKTIVSERVAPGGSSIGQMPFPLGHVMGWVQELAYREADTIVVQTKGASDNFNERGLTRTAIIPNPISLESSDEELRRLPIPCIITIGRLVRQKRQDLILDAFASLAHDFPQWSLVIVGEGQLKDLLQSSAAKRGIEHRCRWMGTTKNPATLLSQGSLFVLASDAEGFPGALCEAMASGLPVVSTRCPYGPEELIENNVNGLLVPTGDSSALAAAMRRLMSDALLREKLGNEARKILEKYSLERVGALWDKVVS
jgi:GalNAc-alpha-(1->4)-GalNAc-alpha-(1->3)-diNAcBac-PP-undecaprenol alpha-1,4-N-acetyl-D-galactosaminyltransferase